MNLNPIYIFSILLLSLNSCHKCDDEVNKEVIENSYTGIAAEISTIKASTIDYSGNNDTGIYSFKLCNKKKFASIELNSYATNGSVQLIVNDSKGNEVINETSSSDNLILLDSNKGKKGTWIVSLIFKDYSGVGYSKVKEKE